MVSGNDDAWSDEAGLALTLDLDGIAVDDPSVDLAGLGSTIVDASALALLRNRAAALSPGADLSRVADCEVVALVQRAWADGRLMRTGAAPRLLPLAPAPAPPAPPPPPASTPRRSAPAAPSAGPSTTFTPLLDVASMVAALRQAARDGVPFCEECERAAAQRGNSRATA